MKKTHLPFADKKLIALFLSQFLPEADEMSKHFRTELTYISNVIEELLATKFKLRLDISVLFDAIEVLQYPLAVEEPNTSLQKKKPYIETNASFIYIGMDQQDIAKLKDLTTILMNDKKAMTAEIQNLNTAIDMFKKDNCKN